MAKKKEMCSLENHEPGAGIVLMKLEELHSFEGHPFKVERNQELFACWCETHMPRKVPEIKDFYEFTRCKQHTTSTCTVFGNKSTHAIFSTLYPLPWIISRSLARLVGLHAI